MNVQELLQLVDDTIDTEDEDFSLARKIRGLNKNQDKLINLIQQWDSLSQWDDPNYTDLPEGYLDTTSGINEYDIREDENMADLLYVVRVYFKDANGTYQLLRKTSPNDEVFNNSNRELPTNTGYLGTLYPRNYWGAYRLSGMRLITSYTPNYNQLKGIKILFIRKPQPILEVDTTKEPGIPNTFHFLLALMTAYDYARAKLLQNRNEILAEIIEEKERLGLFVSREDKDASINMSVGYANNK